ncbi:MAG: alanine racemase, partial [Thermoleophilia bacterium]|nr:alanine racemase [Thermoleophilia bacterium]
QVARAALAGGATRLAVVTVAEAAGLAELDLGVPLILMAPVGPDELVAAIETGAELTAWNEAQLEQIEHAAIVLGRDVGIHVKLDTGMSRFGAKTAAEALAALDAAARSTSLYPAGVWTHFATADEPDDEYFGHQLARFSEFAAEAKRRHPAVLAHAANSAATLREPASHFDFVRCGIAIYGLDPFHEDAAARDLRAALSLRSYVASVRPLAAGESAGYGRRFIAERDTLLATVPIGYGDGWRRSLTNNADALIGGRRLRQRGTVSMDSITVDLGPDSDVRVGAPVTLIGVDGGERITTEEVARRCGTINYEITCGLTARTVRRYDGP